MIELLIVIAIIAILASILFPVFARARENARRSACQSNLKQLGLAFQQYNQDFDGRFPHAQDSDYSVGAGSPPTLVNPGGAGTSPVYPTVDDYLWPAKLDVYTKNRNIFNCPSIKVGINVYPTYSGSPTNVNIQLGWLDTSPVSVATNVGYGYNALWVGGGQWSQTGIAGGCQIKEYPSAAVWYTDGKGALESTIASPSATILLIENNYSNASTAPRFKSFIAALGVTNSDPLDLGGEVWSTEAGANDTYDSLERRHLGGLNVLFADGHVKWMQKEKAGYTPAGLGCNTLNAFVSNPNFLWDRF